MRRKTSSKINESRQTYTNSSFAIYSYLWKTASENNRHILSSILGINYKEYNLMIERFEAITKFPNTRRVQETEYDQKITALADCLSTICKNSNKRTWEDIGCLFRMSEREFNEFKSMFKGSINQEEKTYTLTESQLVDLVHRVNNKLSNVSSNTQEIHGKRPDENGDVSWSDDEIYQIVKSGRYIGLDYFAVEASRWGAAMMQNYSQNQDNAWLSVRYNRKGIFEVWIPTTRRWVPFNANRPISVEYAEAYAKDGYINTAPDVPEY